MYPKESGWNRADARGLMTALETSSILPIDVLPYRPGIREEADLPETCDEPLPAVIHVLLPYNTLGKYMPEPAG